MKDKTNYYSKCNQLNINIINWQIKYLDRINWIKNMLNRCINRNILLIMVINVIINRLIIMTNLIIIKMIITMLIIINNNNKVLHLHI